jgi:class 3 adenylate cyclase
MPLKDDLSAKVKEFLGPWTDIRNGYVVPTANSVTFANTGVRLKSATVLYADLHRSTAMVDYMKDTAAAECYKAFLHCCAKIIKSSDGDITAYDGDRIMAVFLGDSRADNAVVAAMKIHWAMRHIVMPAFKAKYGEGCWDLKHTVGIDDGPLLAVKTGVRDDNDLVWVGPAANYAAKLNSFNGLDTSYPTRVTAEVFNLLTNKTRIASDGRPMWNGGDKGTGFVDVGSRTHFRSRFWWTIA